MASDSSQKFVARNRAPRVQIEYEVELYGAEKSIQLPFVMGVLADLSGKPKNELPPVSDRAFLEIDVDNFDSRLKAIAPRVAFQVPNRLTDDGNLSVDLTFGSMDDFSPGAVAARTEGLKQLLEARQKLSNLLTFMDGKTNAETLIVDALANPELLKSLVASPRPPQPREGEADGADGVPA
jgi:type VI secretion system protein ImpB